MESHATDTCSKSLKLSSIFQIPRQNPTCCSSTCVESQWESLGHRGKCGFVKSPELGSQHFNLPPESSSSLSLYSAISKMGDMVGLAHVTPVCECRRSNSAQQVEAPQEM